MQKQNYLPMPRTNSFVEPLCTLRGVGFTYGKERSCVHIWKERRRIFAMPTNVELNQTYKNKPMNTIIQLKTRHLTNLELASAQRCNRLRIVLAYFGAGLLLAGILLLAGCSTTGTGANPMTTAALTAAVSLGESFALEQHPEAVPFVRAGADVVCSAANGTNIAPADIVAAMTAANITNDTAKLILNGSIAIYDTVFAFIGTNGIQSQPALQDYTKALCAGMEQGLPTAGRAARMARSGAPSMIKSPHLR